MRVTPVAQHEAGGRHHPSGHRACPCPCPRAMPADVGREGEADKQANANHGVAGNNSNAYNTLAIQQLRLHLFMLRTSVICTVITLPLPLP